MEIDVDKLLKDIAMVNSIPKHKRKVPTVKSWPKPRRIFIRGKA